MKGKKSREMKKKLVVILVIKNLLNSLVKLTRMKFYYSKKCKYLFVLLDSYIDNFKK